MEKYDYIGIEMAEGYECDIKQTVENVIQIFNDILVKYDLQSDENLDESAGLDYFYRIKIQSPQRMVIIDLKLSFHDLFDTDDDCEAIWIASQMSDDSIREIIIKKIIEQIEDEVYDTAMDSIDYYTDPNEPDDALAMFERVEEIVDDVHALKATTEKLRERIDDHDQH